MVYLRFQEKVVFGDRLPEFEDYLYTTQKPDYSIREEVFKTSGVTLRALGIMIDADVNIGPHRDGRYGGRMSRLINDCILNAHDPGPRREIQSPNTSLCRVNYDGWPYGFVIVTEDVDANAELLLNYGGGYWEHRAPKIRAAMDKEKRT